MKKKIAVAGCKTTTLELINQLYRDGWSIDLLVTILPELGVRHQVAGYIDLREYAKRMGIPVHHPQTYSLKNPEDESALIAQNIDCLLVIGWQRLIPEWWLEKLSVGALGMHGSPEPLPRGRGRSPMNWAILNGKTSFITHIFRYDVGVDSGAIIAAQKFDINCWDTCETTHFKNRMAMNRLLKKHLPSLLDGAFTPTIQPTNINPTYFEKRSEEDARIKWKSMDMIGLYNHVRCQTRPFPGAFSHLDGSAKKIRFWKVQPFDGHLIFPPDNPGKVVEVFHNGWFLVNVWDGAVLVTEYETPDVEPPPHGARFLDYPK